MRQCSSRKLLRAIIIIELNTNVVAVFEPFIISTVATSNVVKMTENDTTIIIISIAVNRCFGP